jgi:hypothetical protein
MTSRIQPKEKDNSQTKKASDIRSGAFVDVINPLERHHETQ